MSYITTPPTTVNGYTFLKRTIYTSDDTWVGDPLTTAIKVICIGAGGGSGGIDGTAATIQATGGGGGGGYAESFITSPPSTETITVGAGGALGASGGGAGGDGGNSSFGSTVIAPGGYGSVGNTFSGVTRGAPCGNTGTGDISASSTAGGNPSLLPALTLLTFTGVYGGIGGNSIFGCGGTASTFDNSGSVSADNGFNPGGGGGGVAKVSGSSSLAGRKGAPGMVIVDEYA